jgi:hypothetical protein
MLSNGVVGQKVRALKYLGDDADGDSPGGIYAKPGEILIIRKVREPGKSGWAYSVSHEDVTNSTFGVSEGEIEDAGGA